MTHRFAELVFTPHVKALQAEDGSRASYARFEEPGFPARDRLTPKEAEFIAERDSFYMATVSETGWPYVQHRGGPPGFLKVLDDKTPGPARTEIAFADFRGNRQYVSVGNLNGQTQVSLILMDYPHQRRLKLLGHARTVSLQDHPETIARLQDAAYAAKVERGIVIQLEAFDWNCPQHITPRFTQAEIAQAAAPLWQRLHAAETERDTLRAELALLRAAQKG